MTNNVTADKTVSKDTITQKAVQTDKSVKSINDEKTNTIEKKVEKNKKEAKEVVASTYNDLWYYVNEAKESDEEYVIQYTANDAYDSKLTSSIFWDPVAPKTLTITSGGMVDADNYPFITVTEGNTLIIDNLTVKNAEYNYGSAITSQGILIVNNSRFFNNKALDYGAVIYATGLQTNIFNSEFNGNSAPRAGVIYHNTDEGILTLENNTFQANTASLEAAVLYIRGESSSNNNTFTDNIVEASSTSNAVLYIAEGSTATFIDDVFKDNYGDSNAVGSIVGSADFKNCTFRNNHANNVGVFTIDGSATFIDCNFTSNQGIVSTGVFRHCGNLLSIKNSTFDGNDGKTGGDIVYTAQGGGGVATIADSTINTPNQFTDLAKGDGETLGTNLIINGINISETNFKNSSIPVVVFQISDYQGLINLFDTIREFYITDDIIANLTGTEYIVSSEIFIDENFRPNSFTIEGNGRTIDANSNKFINVASGKSLTINNLTVKNAQSLMGGAIESYGTLTINNSQFINNTARTYAGGVIYTDGLVTKIFNSKFTDNKGNNGGVLYQNSINGLLTLENNTFDSNTAFAETGVLYIKGIASSKNNTFESNILEDENAYNGVLYVADSAIATFTDDVFADNYGYYNAVGCIGGSAEFKNCTFRNNRAGNMGVFKIDGSATFTDSSFAVNNATLATGVFSHSGDTLTITNCAFDDNDGQTMGDIVYTDTGAQATITNSIINTPKLFTDIAKGEGETIGTDVTINGLFISETDFKSVPAITNPIVNLSDYQELVDLVNTIKLNQITDNIIANLTGTDYIETEPILIDDTFKPDLFTIEGNQKVIDANKMQFLTINSGKNVTINNLTIQNAEAAQFGAAIYNFGNISVNAVTFKDNTIKGNLISLGAAIYSEGNATVNNSLFVDNVISDGSAGGYGAAIYTEGSLYVYNSVFNKSRIESNNLACGGAIAVCSSISDFVVDNSTFVQSLAERGGAICVSNMVNSGTPGSITVRNTTFIKNDAPHSSSEETLPGYGGAIYNAGPNSVVDNCTLTGNEANYGGALYNNQKLTVTNSNFTNN